MRARKNRAELELAKLFSGETLYEEMKLSLFSAKEDQKRPNLKYDGNSIQSGYKYEYKV